MPDPDYDGEFFNFYTMCEGRQADYERLTSEIPHSEAVRRFAYNLIQNQIVSMKYGR